MRLPRGLRALTHRNFRLFIAGQGTSQIGNWVQLIASSWLVYRLSDSTLMLGLAAFALHIPFLVMAPLAGVYLDRFDVRRVLFFTNSTAFLLSLVMLWLVASGTVVPWHIVAGNLVLGMVNACDAPARQSLLVHLVDDRRDLPNAIALNSSVMNGARFVGPMIGGFVISGFGEAWGFAVNAILRSAVLGALASMRIARRATVKAKESLLGQFRAGVRYAYGFLPSRNALLLLAVTSVTIQSYAPLMPWFARERFHGDSHTLGTLLAAVGLGAFSGMIYLAARPSVRGLFRLIGWTAGTAAVSLVGFAFATNLWAALALLYFLGVGMMLTAASTNTVLQTIVPDDLRGRVASLYLASFLGITPIGALVVGWAAQYLGPPTVLACCGAISLLVTGIYASQFAALRQEIRPVWEQLGIARPRPDL